MKRNWLLSLSAVLYLGVGALALAALPFRDKPLDGTFVGVAILFAAICFWLGYAAFRARAGSFSQKRNFAIAGGVFCGGVAGLSGWGLAIVLGVPLIIGLLGMREIWWRGYEG